MHALPMARRGPRLATALGLALAIASAIVVARDVHGQAPAAPAAPAPTAVASGAAPTPIPATEVVGAAEAAGALLRRIQSLLEPDPQIQEIEAQLPVASERIAVRLEDTSRMIAEGGQIHALDHVARSWHTVRTRLSQAADTVNARLGEIDGLLADLQHHREVWATTRAAAVAAGDPPAIVQRIDEVLGALRQAQQRLGRRRAAVLDLQSRVLTELYNVDSAIAKLGEARVARVGTLFQRDGRPLWQLGLGPRSLGEVLPRVRDFLTFELLELREYMATGAPALLACLLLFVALCALFRKARTKTAAWLEAEPGLERRTIVFQVPFSAAFILAVVTMRLLLPQVPHLLSQLASLLTLAPVLRILRLTAPPEVQPAVWIVAGFFVVDHVRDVLSAAPQVEQLLLLLELTAAILILAWALSGRSRRGSRLLAAIRLPQPRLFAQSALALLLFAVVAGATGYVQLARLVGTGVLGGVYAGAALQVAVRAADALIALALRVRPLRLLHMVGRHRALMEHRAHRLLVALATVAWAVALLQSLALDQILLSAARAVLALPVAPKGFDVDLGDVLLTALIIWLAFAVSSFVRFALEEDVFPRLALPRGIPYALATLLHYSLLVTGFVLGLGAIGLDLNRFTILAGAFGVGIGFGLQNVVNNFVSGLILLFERPVQVGDIVQIGQLTGEMRRIGIRSSTVRTGQGADVIVPNSTLIAEQVTNWTFSDRKRRIDVAVGVAYGTDPERVLSILRDIGRGHAAVLREPAPLALLSRFGDSALEFELQVWTTRIDVLAVTRSEIAVALLRALDEAGIEIPFPQRDLHLRTVAAATSPSGDDARGTSSATDAPGPQARRAG